MEKVKVTKKQAKAIEIVKGKGEEDSVLNRHAEIKGDWLYKEMVPLRKFSVSKIAKALYIGYEVEPEFKVGDWVVCDIVPSLIGRLANVRDADRSGLRVDCIDYEVPQSVPLNDLRHATPSEIAAEKERSFFDRHGRKPWELKKWDLLRRYKYEDAYTVESVEENRVYFKEGGSRSLENIKTSFKVACFAEYRLDRGEHDE